MIAYVLIIILHVNGGTNVVFHDFSSYAKCEAAKHDILEVNQRTIERDMKALFCVPK